MNKNINQYFADAERRSEEFHSIEGYNVPDDFQFATDGGTEQAPASVPAPQQVQATSSPFIIRVQNTNTLTDESNVVIFDAFGRIQYAQTAGDHWGNSNNIRIYSAIAGTTYLQLLYEAMQRPFVIGLTYVSGTSAGIIQPISISESNARGITNTRPLINVKDPYQNLDTVLAQKMVYKVDGFTTMTISSIARAETLILYLYPCFDTDVARTLSNNGITQQFGKPGVIREQKLVLGS